MIGSRNFYSLLIVNFANKGTLFGSCFIESVWIVALFLSTYRTRQFLRSAEGHAPSVLEVLCFLHRHNRMASEFAGKTSGYIDRKPLESTGTAVFG